MIQVNMIIVDKASLKTVIRASFFQNKRDENKKVICLPWWEERAILVDGLLSTGWEIRKEFGRGIL